MEKLARELFARNLATIVSESTVMLLMTCVALVGNTLVFFTVWRNSDLRSITSMFVVSLAITDILMYLLSMPFTVITLIRGRWLSSQAICVSIGLCNLTLALTSIQTMVLIAVSRYFCVVKRAKYQQIFKPRRTLFFALIPWLVSLIAATPPLFYGGFYFHPGKAICIYNVQDSIPYVRFLVDGTFGSSFFIITFCYTSVYRYVSQTSKVFAVKPHSPYELRAHVQETKITKLMVAVFVGFFCCWIPVGVTIAIEITGDEPALLPRQVYLMTTFLAYISSMINPVIYGVGNRAFRQEFKKMLKGIVCWKYCCKRKVPVIVISPPINNAKN